MNLITQFTVIRNRLPTNICKTSCQVYIRTTKRQHTVFQKNMVKMGDTMKTIKWFKLVTQYSYLYLLFARKAEKIKGFPLNFCYYKCYVLVVDKTFTFFCYFIWSKILKLTRLPFCFYLFVCRPSVNPAFQYQLWSYVV